MNTILTTAVRYTYAPLMVFGLNLAAYFVVADGHSYAWLAPLLGLAFALAFAAERVAPWHDEWNHEHNGDNVTNFWHVVIYELQNINGVLLIPLIAWLTPWDPVWPTSWPLWAQLIVAILFADLAFTVMHLLSHRVPVLWRLHAVHHGVGRLYGFNGLIRHPLHQVVDMLIGTAPLVMLGMPVDVAVLLGFTISVQLIVQHSNVAYELGPLKNHLAIGRVHHLHHVNWGVEGDCNFGLFLTLWDRLLGTFHPEPPREIKAGDMGVDELPNFPRGYIAQFMLPFRYHPGQGIQDLTPGNRTSGATVDAAE